MSKSQEILKLIEKVEIKQHRFDGTRLTRGYFIFVDGVQSHYVGQHKDDNYKWRIVKGKDLSGELVKIFNNLRDAKQWAITNLGVHADEANSSMLDKIRKIVEKSGLKVVKIGKDGAGVDIVVAGPASLLNKALSELDKKFTGRVSYLGNGKISIHIVE